MRTGIIFVNSEKCVACKRCTIACAVAHSPYNDIVDMVMDGGTALSRVEFRPVGKRVVPIECRHCEGALCVVACPTGALGRSEEGAPVLLHDELCVGCKSCVVACPYGAIRTSAKTGQVYKCDGCIDRIQVGELPACVEACPVYCLTYETIENLEKKCNQPQEAVVSLVQAAMQKGD